MLKKIQQTIKSDMFDECFQNFRFGYLCLMMLYAITREILPLHNIAGSEVLSYGLFFIGLIIIGCSFLLKPKQFTDKNIIIMSVFVLVCLLSTLINRQFDFLGNIKSIGWTMIYFFVAYASAADSRAKEKYDRMTVVSLIVVVTLLVIVIISLPMYLYNIDYTYYEDNALGISSNQGFSSEYLRLWGIFDDANRGAVYSLVGICCAIYLFIKKKNVPTRIFLIVACLLFLSFVVLSQSRTAQVIILIACVWCVFYLGYTKFKKKKIILGLLSAVLSVALCLGILFSMSSLFPYIKKVTYNLTPTETITAIHQSYDKIYINAGLNITNGLVENTDKSHPNEENKTEEITSVTSTTNDYDVENSSENLTENIESETSVTEEVTEAETKNSSDGNSLQYEELKRTDILNTDLSNGRIQRWKDGLKLFTLSPIIGTSPRGVVSFAKANSPETSIAKYDFSIHNSFIEVLTGTGAVGALCILILMIFSIINVAALYFNGKFDLKFIFSSLIVVIFFCMSLLQTEIFFILTFGGLFFWYALGTAISKKT